MAIPDIASKFFGAQANRRALDEQRREFDERKAQADEQFTVQSILGTLVNPLMGVGARGLSQFVGEQMPTAVQAREESADKMNMIKQDRGMAAGIRRVGGVNPPAEVPSAPMPPRPRVITPAPPKASIAPTPSPVNSFASLSMQDILGNALGGGDAGGPFSAGGPSEPPFDAKAMTEAFDVLPASLRPVNAPAIPGQVTIGDGRTSSRGPPFVAHDRRGRDDSSRRGPSTDIASTGPAFRSADTRVTPPMAPAGQALGLDGTPMTGDYTKPDTSAVDAKIATMLASLKPDDWMDYVPGRGSAKTFDDDLLGQLKSPSVGGPSTPSAQSASKSSTPMPADARAREAALRANDVATPFGSMDPRLHSQGRIVIPQSVVNDMLAAGLTVDDVAYVAAKVDGDNRSAAATASAQQHRRMWDEIKRVGDLAPKAGFTKIKIGKAELRLPKLTLDPSKYSPDNPRAMLVPTDMEAIRGWIAGTASGGGRGGGAPKAGNLTVYNKTNGQMQNITPQTAEDLYTKATVEGEMPVLFRDAKTPTMRRAGVLAWLETRGFAIGPGPSANKQADVDNSFLGTAARFGQRALEMVTTSGDKALDRAQKSETAAKKDGSPRVLKVGESVLLPGGMTYLMKRTGPVLLGADRRPLRGVALTAEQQAYLQNLR